MNDIKVSIIVVVYNHEKYLKRCLDSLVNQITNFNYQIIVHDDASTDKSVEIIKQFQQQYPDKIIPILQNQNKYSKHIDFIEQFVIPIAKGKYISFCEGDDYYNNNKLQKQVDVLQQNNFIICFSKTQIINEEGKIKPQNEFPPLHLQKYLNLKNGLINCYQLFPLILNYQCNIHVSSIMIQLNAYKNYYNNFYLKNIMRQVGIGDVCLISYMLYIYNFYYVDEILSYYRTGSIGSFSNKINNNENFKNQVINHWNIFYRKYDEYTEYKFHNYLKIY